MRGKEQELKVLKREQAESIRRVHQLEIENTKLKAKLGKEGDFDEDSI